MAATLVGSTGQFLHAPYPPHGLGLLLNKEGHREEAEQVLQEALMLCHRMAAPYAEAKVLYTTGVISYSNRELAPARQRFEEAREICTRLGERLYALRIEETLVGLS